MQSMKIISPNGHLGFAPLKPESFAIGVDARPDYIGADSGSDDVGPVPLGSDTSTSPLGWQTQDLEHMLLASRRIGVPMIIGSAGDTGSNSRVDLYLGIIRELARKHGLAPFKLGWYYSEVSKERLRAAIENGEEIAGLDGRAALTLEELEATDRIVAMAGVHPYIKLLRQGVDVIIGGRSSDCAVFAAPAIHNGFPEALSYYLGKVLECASFCAEPYGAKETVLGEITSDEVRVTAMHPGQRCTVASVAGHVLMHERSNPFYEYGRRWRKARHDQLPLRAGGPANHAHHRAQFREPAPEYRVKLEGSGKVGERYVGLVGIRDPYSVANVDRMIDWARQQVRERFGNAQFGNAPYELHYTVYGRDGVMGAMEPNRDHPAHEIAVLVQGVAPTRDMAEEVALIGTRQMFYARLPEVKGTAGSVAFPLDEVMRASPAYRWTVNHTYAVPDGLTLHDTHVEMVGV